MRTEKKAAIIVAAALIIVGMAIVAVSVKGVGYEFKKLVGTAEYEEKTYDIAEDFDSVKIDAGFNDIAIVKSDDKDAHFLCYEDEKNKFEVEVKNKTLFITEKSKKNLNINFGIVNEAGANTLYLPKEAYDSFVCKLGSGDIIVDQKLSFGEMVIHVGSGDIIAHDINCKKSLAVKTSSGSIDLADSETEGKLSAETGSGKIKLDGCVGSSVDLHTGSGDISFFNCDGSNITIKTGSGDVEGTLRTGKKFEAKVGSGDINVPSDSEGGTCTIKAGSGDIDISVIG